MIMTGMPMTITSMKTIIMDMMDMMAMTTMITAIGKSTQVMTMEMMNIQIMSK